MKKCDCPYSKSCHEVRQDLQSEIRERGKASIKHCIFFKILKPMYEEGKIRTSKKKGVNMDIKINNIKPCIYCMSTGKLKAMQSVATYGDGSVRGKDTQVKCKFCNGTGIIK